MVSTDSLKSWLPTPAKSALAIPWPMFELFWRDFPLGEKRRELRPPLRDTSNRNSLLLVSDIRLFFSCSRRCRLSNRYCFSNLCAYSSCSPLFYCSSSSFFSLISCSSLASTALLSLSRFSFYKLRTKLLAFSYQHEHIWSVKENNIKHSAPPYLPMFLPFPWSFYWVSLLLGSAATNQRPERCPATV